jgi:hypothetical protein
MLIAATRAMAHAMSETNVDQCIDCPPKFLSALANNPDRSG